MGENGRGDRYAHDVTFLSPFATIHTDCLVLCIGWAKAQYAVGYFTEMGIGCRRDTLQANVWYVQAADHGSDTAKQRLAIIRAAASGDPGIPMSSAPPKSRDLASGGKKKWGIF